MARQTTSPDNLPYYQGSDTPDGASQQQDLATVLQSVLNARVPVELTGTLSSGVTVPSAGANVGSNITVTTAGLYLCLATMGLYNAGAGTYGIVGVNNPSATLVIATRQYIATGSTIYIGFARLLRITTTGAYSLRAASLAGNLSSDATGITPSNWTLTRIAP